MTSIISTTSAIVQQPGQFDILCGRCKDAFNHSGNRRFRAILRKSLPQYETLHSRTKISALISDITSVLMNELGVRFLKQQQQDKVWIELDEKEARKKVGHALRDMSAAQKETSANKNCSLKSKQIQIYIPKRPEEDHSEEDDKNKSQCSKFAISFYQASIVSEDDESAHTDNYLCPSIFNLEPLQVSSGTPTFLIRETSIDSLNPRTFHDVIGDEWIFEQDFELDLW
jgi:hypothetical protein